MVLRYTLCLLALVIGSVHANDCVPNSYTTLSYLIGSPVTNKTWMHTFYPNSDAIKELPSIKESIDIWKQLEPGTDLKIIFSGYDFIGKTVKTELQVKEGVPHFWVGYPSQQTTTSTNPNEAHAGVVYFYRNGVILINTVNVRLINNKEAFDFYIESLDLNQLIDRTIYIYEVVPVTRSINLQPFITLLPPASW